MNRLSKRERTTQKLLALWSRHDRERRWLSYKEIVEELSRVGISERTAARYLGILVHENKLDKYEKGYKKTFYRPSYEFWKTISLSDKQFRVSEESLSRIGTYIMDKMRNTLMEGKAATERISNLVEKEIAKMPEDKRYGEPVLQVISRVLSRETLNKEERNTLNSLVDSLIKKTIYHCLSNPHVFGRITDQYDLASILEDDVWDLVSAYMNLWGFIYKHPGAFPEFQRYVESHS